MAAAAAAAAVLAKSASTGGAVPWIAIMGATGTGKTKLALQLAQRYHGEVINTDAMQLYRGLDIATNKATVAERAAAPHHLIDFLDPFADKPWTVVDYRNAAVPLLQDVEQRGATPVLVGGTHYYLEALLLDNLLADDERGEEPAAHPELLASLPALDAEQLRAQLLRVDPVMAQRLHPHDVRKIRRSLQIYAQTGQPQSQLLIQQAARGAQLRHAPVCCFWLDSEEAVLDRRLNERVDAMLGQGLLPELLDFYQRLTKQQPDFLLLRPSNNKEGLPADMDEQKVQQPGHDAVLLEAGTTDVSATANGPRAPAPRFDYTRGILQAIGLKEFQPLFDHLLSRGWASTAAPFHSSSSPSPTERQEHLNNLLDSPEAKELMDAGIEQIKLGTRQYARRQLRWIKRRLQSAFPGYYLYKLDTSQPELWETRVHAPAVERIEGIIRGEPVPSEAEAPVTFGADRLATDVNHACAECGRTINGQHEWEAHLKSRKHRRAVERSKRPPVQYPHHAKAAKTMEAQLSPKDDDDDG